MHASCLGAVLAWVARFGSCSTRAVPSLEQPKEPRSAVSGTAASYLVSQLSFAMETTSSCPGRNFRTPEQTCATRREILPLPRPTVGDLEALTHRLSPSEVTLIVQFAILVCSRLNSLNAGVGSAPFSARRGNTAQRSVVDHVGRRALDLLSRLQDADCPQVDPVEALDLFEPSSAPPRPVLLADLVDLPTVAGTCDPTGFLGPVLRRRMEAPADIFPAAPIGVESVGIGVKEKPGFVALLGRMWVCGKVGLSLGVSGVGSFFVVGGPDHPNPGDLQIQPLSWMCASRLAGSCFSVIGMPHRILTPTGPTRSSQMVRSPASPRP